MSAIDSVIHAPRRAVLALRRRHIHTLVTISRGDAAFTVFGDAPARARRLARYYFEHGETPELRYAMHGVRWEASAQALAAKHGMVAFAESHHPHHLADLLLRQQPFVPLAINIGTTEQAYLSTLSESARDDARRARNRRFTLEVHRDAAWAHEFHDRFHRPSISRRHGEDGFVANEHEFVDLLTRNGGEFVCVVKDGRRVAAVLASPRQPTYLLHRLGWRDGDDAILKDGAVGAIYWYAVRRARELGCARVSLGGTPPVLEEGVTRYKMKWNAEIDADYATPWSAHDLLLDPRHAGVHAMLARASLVLQSRCGSYFVLSGRTPAEVSLCEPMRRTLTAWFRVAPTPDASRESANAGTPLPPHLRAWCVNEPLLTRT